MSQAALFVFVQMVVRAACRRNAQSALQVSNSMWTMAYDGKNWLMKRPSDSYWGHAIPWQETPECKIPPPRNSVFFSQSREDIDLYNAFFCSRTGGTFVELGALDGEKFSNTKFFEDHLGWSGLLIEATPDSAAALQKNRGNPKNTILAEGVCPDGQGTMPFLIDGDPAVHGNPDTMGANFEDKWHSGVQHKIQVPCRSLSTQLKEFVHNSGADHIDLFSLDVEGGELAVLQTFNFDVPVHHWLIEMDGRDIGKDQGVRELLTSHGYVRSHIGNFSGRNEVWVMSQID